MTNEQSDLERCPTSAEAAFWDWFKANENELFDFEVCRDKIFARLSTEMHKLHSSLTFEFGPKNEGQREFVISADGIKEAFPKVQSLHACAPSLPRWKFVRFRPRREPVDIKFRGVLVKAASVRVAAEPAGKMMDLTVFVPKYTQSNKQAFAGIVFLMLDQALGEFEVETRVGKIEIKPISKAPPLTFSLKELPELFDSLEKIQ
jgi:hypothetical protein